LPSILSSGFDDVRDTEHPRGLSSAEAAGRLVTEGYNELPRSRERSLLRILLGVLKEPMFQLLLGAGAVYLLLGSLGDALLLLAFAMGSILITVYQDSRTEHALEALRDLSSPRALVIRDGEPRRIPGRNVVRGDLLLLSEGDRVPADLRLLSAQDLMADESLLTGESMPVAKRAGAADGTPKPGGDQLPWLFSGTLIVRGSGLGEVYATGLRSELGKIGKLLAEVRSEPTALHVQTRRLVRIVASVGLSCSALVALLYGLTRDAWLDGLLVGIALAMSMLPEEFPLVLTVFMALGAWRLARRRVLTRTPAAIEALGAATVLCTDKTGTLTENRMAVAELRCNGESEAADAPMPPAARELLAGAQLACKPMPVDPMDKAVLALAGAADPQLQLLREYGLSAELPAMAMAWQQADGTLRIAAKGAPEAVAGLCRLDATQGALILAEADDMATRGLRVLGVAVADWQGELPQSQRAFAFRWLGLVAFSDPIRATAAAAIRECRAAGIRVAMITGDYPATARAIAHQAGIAGDTLLEGAELERLSDAELRERVRRVAIYARVVPQQKLRIVEALKANGEVVAMTGDGVNDAPSLRAAHIGVAMGGRGTDVAREAAGLVLLDDDFGSLVAAVRQGRRIYDNLRKAMCYILAVHVPIAGLSLLPLLFGWPMILSPIHIVFLELVIDPVCSIVFEAETEESDLMSRPPRDPREPLFSRRLVAWSLLQGVAVLALLTLLFLTALQAGMPIDDVRALSFAALVSTNLGLIFVNRSFGVSIITALRQPNPMLWRVLAVTAALLITVLYLPAARELFHFGRLHVHDLAIALLSGLVLLAMLEWTKRGVGLLRRVLH
jgi:Ca2+-transporting ATPase